VGVETPDRRTDEEFGRLRIADADGGPPPGWEEPLYPGEAGPAGGPNRILLLVTHRRNRSLLTGWFAAQTGYECVDGFDGLEDADGEEPRTPPSDGATTTDDDADASADAALDAESFDLVLVDVRALETHGDWLAARFERERPLPLPCLLLATERTATRFFSPATGHERRDLVDDVLITPIDSTLLDRRIRTYVRLRQQAAELDRRHDQLSLLTQVVRHDISNAATVVTGWGEILRRQVDDGDDADALERVLRAGQRIVEIVENSRDLTMLLDAGEDPETQAMALAPVLQSEVDAVSRIHESSIKTVTVDAESTPPTVRVLAGGMLSSVFANLLSNAVRHNDTDAAEIAVTVDVRPAEVVVRVADNGPGIPDAEKERVFEPSTKRGGSPGDGLGLSLVKRLVDSYGGRVWFEDADGGGAVACVALRRTAPA
jgi:signal transduction histidine kinase